MDWDEMRNPIPRSGSSIDSAYIAGLMAARPGSMMSRLYARAYDWNTTQPPAFSTFGESLGRVEDILQRVDARLDEIEARSIKQESVHDHSREELSHIRRFFSDATTTEAEDAFRQGRFSIDAVLEMALESLENSGAIAAEAVADASRMRRTIDRNARMIDEQQERIRQAIATLASPANV